VAMEKQFYIYILASKKNGTLYIGITSDLIRRIWEHKNNVVKGFTKKYSVHTLVYCEVHPTFETAVQREKNLKKWKRAWKIKLIEEKNSEWRDLYPDILS